MIKAILVQGENDITLEYDSLEAVEELIKVVGTGSEINDLLVRIRLDMPGEDRLSDSSSTPSIAISDGMRNLSFWTTA